MNCNDSLISGLTISDSTTAILLIYCDNNNISHNTIRSSDYEILLASSGFNNISFNTITSTNYYRIYLSNSNYNKVNDNQLNDFSNRIGGDS